MRLLIKYPSRSRPELFKQTLDKYYAYLSGEVEVRFIITIDDDDPSMNTPELRTYLKAKGEKCPVGLHVGYSRNKVHAINKDIPKTFHDGTYKAIHPFDVLLVASDDMIPQVAGYDKIICDQMSEHFPGLDGALWFPDGRRDDLCTLPVMGYWYFAQFGYVYNPIYQSVFCDNEFQAVATQFNRLVRVNQVIIKHEWIRVTGKDELYLRNEDRYLYNTDKAVFEKRQSRGFPNKGIVWAR